MIDFSVQATVHGMGADKAKNSLYNAIKDASVCKDLTLIFIDTHDGKHHIAGPEIRTIAESPDFKAYEAALHARGHERD